MGGKTWSRAEELLFWRVVIPQSPKAVNPGDRISDWEACALMMQDKMGAQARRRYTKLMLFEHYFQNVATGHKSPHASQFVSEHKRHLAARQGNAASASRESTASTASTNVSVTEPQILPTGPPAPFLYGQREGMPAIHQYPSWAVNQHSWMNH